MLSHLGYCPQGGGKGGVGLCAKARLQMKTLFARCGGNVPIALDDAFKHLALFPILSVTSHWVPSMTLLLQAPKQMAQIVLHRLGLTWMIPFLCQTFHLDK